MADPEYKPADKPDSFYKTHGRKKLDMVDAAYFNRKMESRQAEIDIYKSQLHDEEGKPKEDQLVKGTNGWYSPKVQHKKLKTEEDLNNAILTYAKNSGLEAKNFKGGDYELIEHMEDIYGINHGQMLQEAAAGRLDYKGLIAQFESGREEQLKAKRQNAARSAVSTAADIADLLKDEKVAPYLPADFDPDKFGINQGVQVANYLDNEAILAQILSQFTKGKDKKKDSK